MTQKKTTIPVKLDQLEGSIAHLERVLASSNSHDALRALRAAKGVLSYAKDLEERIAVLEAALEAALQEAPLYIKATEDLRTSVVAFCAPYAVQYAEERGLPKGHLFAVHYDILKGAGARMDSFTRVEAMP